MAVRGDPLTFPDAARVAAERSLADTASRIHDLQEAGERLRGLLHADRALLEELELPRLLKLIVEKAVDLVGAEHGALGIVTLTGRVEDVIFPDSLPRPAPEPDPAQLAPLEDLTTDPRTAGFGSDPAGTGSFLGAPIRVHGDLYANLYLTHGKNGTFALAHEQLIASFADTAGLAVGTSLLYAKSRTRKRWAEAAAEITASLASARVPDPVAEVAERVLALGDCTQVQILVPAGHRDKLQVRVARGIHAEPWEGLLSPAVLSVASSVIRARQPRLIHPPDHEPTIRHDSLEQPGSIIAVPLTAEGESRGVLVAIRNTDTCRFTTDDLELVADFATHASLALALTDYRDGTTHDAVEVERAQIARDLQDRVIQQLFGDGLELEALAGEIGPGPAYDRLIRLVKDLDRVIGEIRTAVFALSPRQHTRSLRHQLLDLIIDPDLIGPPMPSVTFTGSLDTDVAAGLTEDLLAAVHDGLAITARLSHRRRTSVEVNVTGTDVSLEVVSDGVELGLDRRRRDLARMRTSANDRGGTFTLASTGEGTQLCWSVPLDPGAESGPTATRSADP